VNRALITYREPILDMQLVQTDRKMRRWTFLRQPGAQSSMMSERQVCATQWKFLHPLTIFSADLFLYASPKIPAGFVIFSLH